MVTVVRSRNQRSWARRPRDHPDEAEHGASLVKVCDGNMKWVVRGAGTTGSGLCSCGQAELAGAGLDLGCRAPRVSHGVPLLHRPPGSHAARAGTTSFAFAPVPCVA